MILLVVVGSLVMVGLVVAASWAMVGLAVFGAWFVVMSAGLVMKLVAALLIVGGLLMWRQIRRRPQPRALDQ
jgi:hypothetical protein